MQAKKEGARDSKTGLLILIKFSLPKGPSSRYMKA
jgi:hypothetical protein